MSDGMRIVTPRGELLVNARGNAIIQWNGGARQMDRRYNTLQKFIDQTVVRHMDPYVPLKTGVLKKSVILGSRMGSGELVYIAPYSRPRYYIPGRLEGRNPRSKRGSKWADRMMADRLPQIVREVRDYSRRLMP